MCAAPAWLDELDLRADGPPWLGMGLRKVDEDVWLAPDDHRAVELAERERLLAERWDDVVHLGPGTDAAGEEACGLVAAWNRGHGLDEPIGPGLVAAARVVQEDLVVMVARPDVDGAVRHHLDAAVLCFPSHWRLREKAGGSAVAIHGPVPGYDVDLSDKVDRYLARLRPGVVGARRNWSIHDTPALHAPSRPRPPTVTDPSALWLRSERQTLRALPESGAVLFTIRVQQCPFPALAERPDIAAALADRLAAQPAELVDMNGLAGREVGVTAWLRALAR